MEKTNTPENVSKPTKNHFFCRVTPLSKYLAMALFVLMPFVGGYVGYTYAPEKVVEVEKIVAVTEPSETVSENLAQLDIIVESESPDGNTLLIRAARGHFWKYDGDYYVYSREFESSTFLGPLAAFEWAESGYRYKPLPVQDELYDCQMNADGVVLEQTCEPKLDQIEWIEEGV